MASFPVLKTGAVAQYSATRQIRCSTQVVEFVDGTEQRFRNYSQPLLRWVIRLELLDATEMQALVTFIDSVGSMSGFSFIDPWDGSTHPNCVVEGSEFSSEWLAEWNGRTELTIRENRV